MLSPVHLNPFTTTALAYSYPHTIPLLKCQSSHQRRQSGLKSEGSWIRVKNFDFLGTFPKNFDFFRQFHKKIDISGQISEKFPFSGNFTKKINFSRQIYEEF